MIVFSVKIDLFNNDMSQEKPELFYQPVFTLQNNETLHATTELTQYYFSYTLSFCIDLHTHV